MTAARRQRELEEVNAYLPSRTRMMRVDSKDVWLVQKDTGMGLRFEFALYFDPNESTPGYCCQVLSPEIERAWKHPHIGHIYSDGILCLGPYNPRTGPSLRFVWARSCIWAEGMAAMLAGKHLGQAVHFPLSINNSKADLR